MLRKFKFEKQSRKQAKKVPRLTLEDIESAFEEVESILSNLWMITNLASYQFDSDLNWQTARAARDLVDLMIFGSIGEVVEAVGIPVALMAGETARSHYWQFRDSLKIEPVAGKLREDDETST